ncbi:GNAT family N-acetyltransferase [Auraticoccus cholistanensis]|uniref:GNAT family N-acetyltransferase n=1 Tax=Auraticoccus cholistanensis TaxID=2656650 RepID=UPI0018D254C2
MVERSEVLVRPAEPADAEAVARVHTLGWQRGYAGLLPQDYLDALPLAAAEERWRTQLRREDRTTDELVAVVGGRVRGIAVVGPAADPDAPADGSRGELFVLYVHPEHWGGGLGHALHERALQRLRQRGFTSATLWVLRGNERAARFYRRRGWTDDRLLRTDDRGEVVLHERRLARDLSDAPPPRT